MGLLYSDNSVRNNNELNINACSGGIYKTYKESWFTRFHLESNLAETLFKPYGNKMKVEPDTYESGYCGSYTKEHKEPVIIIQMIICGDMEVIAEVIREKDFIKYFPDEETEDLKSVDSTN